MLLLLLVVLAVAAAGLPWIPGPPLVARLPRASVVFSRPVVLVPGARVEARRVRAHLEAAHYRPAGEGVVVPGRFRLQRRDWQIGRRGFRYPGRREPAGVFHVTLDASGRIARITGPEGTPRDALFLEPVPLAVPAGTRRVERDLVALDAMPAHLVDAVLVAEDRRFFVHPGVDPLRVAGAALENARERRIVEGGSTLTQQLVKNVYLTSERTWARKLREAWIALWLELRYSKREILEAYLNEVYLGQDGARAIHGVGPAARFWFGKDPGELELAEAALLAGMIRSPSALAPDRHPERARARRDQVLAALHESGRIDSEALERARAAPLGARRRGGGEVLAPRFAARIAAELRESYGEDALTHAGLRVFTTLDPVYQRAAREAVGRELARLETGYPLLRRRRHPLQAALVALDPRNGEVLAWVGGRHATRGAFDRVSGAHRQPGSVFKPVVALAAFTLHERGVAPFTLATRLEDAPLVLEVEGQDWAPSNHDHRFRGAVSVREALEQSLNVPMARLGMEVGLVQVAETARRLGITSPLRPIPSLSLGAFEVSPLEVTAAYAVLAAAGTRREPRLLVALEQAGRVRPLPTRRTWAAFAPAPVALVTAALRGAVERGTARGLRRLGVRGPVAGKTGTSNEARDAWLVAYTPELVVGVWVGFDDDARVGLSGARAALPIAARFLLHSVGADGWAEFPEPAGLERVAVDPRSGLRAGAGCPGPEELFIAGTAPRETCHLPPWPPGRWIERILRRALP